MWGSQMSDERTYRSHYSLKSRMERLLSPKNDGKVSQAVRQSIQSYYRRRLERRVLKVPNPLVLVGGDRFGGSGKTPVALYIATYLARHNRVFLVVRPTSGHKFKGLVQSAHDASRAGDECAMLFEQKVPGLAILSVSNFLEVSQFCNKTNVLVLDDGLRSGLYGDQCLRIMLTDGGASRGPYRHSRHDLNDGGLSWVHSSFPTAKMDRGINIATVYSPELLINIDGESKGVDWLVGRKVIIATGIGNPEPFIDMIINAGAKVQEVYIFADHESFDFEKLCPQDCVVITTQKDLCRTSTLYRKSVYALKVKLKFIKGEKVISSRLRSIISND